MIGLETLVPPKTRKRPLYTTATPVLGLASADTSPMVRIEQPVSFCQEGFGKTWLQPLPAPDQTVSVHPRVPPPLCRVVPPTAVTYCDPAGNCGPKPPSPVLAVIMCPG